VAEYVEYSESLVKSIEDSLRKSFRQPTLFLTRREKRGSSGDIQITLQRGVSGREFVAGSGDGRDHWVMEIAANENRESGFWFGFLAIFAVAESQKHTLQDVSVLVFQDLRGNLVPVFRAEWAQRDVTNAASNHAQPHWHFTQSPSHIEDVVRAQKASEFGEAREFSPEVESGLFAGLPDLGKFHFAMTHLWEERTQEPNLKRQFNSNQFSAWFRSLTNYIADQIAYLVKHMPPSEAAEVREFVPSGA